MDDAINSDTLLADENSLESINAAVPKFNRVNKFDVVILSLIAGYYQYQKMKNLSKKFYGGLIGKVG